MAIEGTNLNALTDSLGRYLLVGVPAGPQVLTLERLGYAVVRTNVVVPASGVLVHDLQMAVQALELENITVTADPVGRARGELGTASVIGEDAIRHQSATSLSGLLELLPGVPVSPPGLTGVQQIALRVVPTSDAAGGSTAADAASFGTLIILDGIPQSNNANLQTLGPRGEASFASAAGGGVDLRSIPASTIQRVEVLRGVPSARYGDLTQGAVIVETRAGVVEPELSAKLDPRSAEGSAVGGRRADWLGGTGTLLFNAARTRSTPGLSDDQSLRVAGQFAHRLEVERDSGVRWTFDTRLDAHRLVDDRPENANIRPERSSESRDLGIRFSERAVLETVRGDRHTFTGALAAVDQHAFSRLPRVRGTTPFTDRLEPGRAVGRFIGGRYVSELSLDGRPWMLYTRLESLMERQAAGFLHRLRPGMELRREWNSGKGYQFDVAFPPQSSFNAVEGFDRPRRFSDIPALVTSAFYLDDAMRRTLPGDMVLNLQAGLRADLLHDGSTWFSGVRDVLVQPRLNIELQPRPWIRLRGGWGRTAKLPALSSLFPAPQYYDVVNVNWYAPDPAERLAVLTTFIENPANPGLEMAVGDKLEAGVELSVGGALLGLVAFKDDIRNGFGIRRDPSFLVRDLFQLSDSTLGNGVPPEILEPPYAADTVPILVDRPANVLNVESSGLEFTAFFPEIRAISTRIQVQGAWVQTERRSEALYFGPYDVVSDFQLRDIRERIPYWEPLEERGERAIATYRVIHQQPDAGLVITATIQHNLLDRFRDRGPTDSLAWVGYLTRAGRLVPVAEGERAEPEFADLQVPRTGQLPQSTSTPADWLLGVQVSKTLPLDGRLTFWSFNLLDREGVFGDAETRARLYPQMRFGFELSMPARGLVAW